MEGNYLITTDAWFIAPNGKQYKAAWGNVKIMEDNILGIKTNKGSTNWYAKIGSNNNHIIIAGCQIQYAILCDKKPNIGMIEETNTESLAKYNRETLIYIAQ